MPQFNAELQDFGLGLQTTYDFSICLANHSVDRQGLAARRIADYMAEPSACGNLFVGLPNGTPDAFAREAAHKRRIAEELMKLEGQLP